MTRTHTHRQRHILRETYLESQQTDSRKTDRKTYIDRQQIDSRHTANRKQTDTDRQTYKQKERKKER